VVLLAPEQSLLYWIVATAIVFLALLGAAAAAVGGTPLFKSALRVAFWGTFAMAVTAGVGAMAWEQCSAPLCRWRYCCVNLKAAIAKASASPSPA